MRKFVRIIGAVLALCLAFSLCACGDKTEGGDKTVTEITVGQVQTEYFVGDAFAGGKITVKYSDNTTAEADMTAAMLTGFDTATAGTKQITVTYEGKSAQFSVTVKERPAATVSEISVKDTPKEYFVNEAFAGGKITVKYSDDTTADVDMTAAMLTGFDTSAKGTKQVTVTYEGKSTQFSITVKEREAVTVEEITVKQTKSEYFVGDAFDGGKITVKYSDTTTADVDMTAAMLTGFDTATAGVKQVTVTYEGKTAQFTVTVKEKASVPVEQNFDLDATLADTEEGSWAGVTEQTVFDGTNKFLTFREKAHAAVAYTVKGMSAGTIEMKLRVDVRNDTTATVTFSNQGNDLSAFCYAAGGKNYSLEFASDSKMYVKKWIDGKDTTLSGSKSSANIPMQLSSRFTNVKIEVAETSGAVNIDVTVGTSKLLSVTDSTNPILGGGAVGFSYMGTGGMVVGGKNSDANAYVKPDPLALPVFESPADVAKATDDVDLLADFDNTWTGRERIFTVTKGDSGSVQLTSKDNPEEPQAGVTEYQAVYKDKIFGDVQLEYTFNVISQGEWLMFWFRCVPEESNNVSIWGNKKTGEKTNSYSVLIDPRGIVQFHKWTGTTQIYMNGTGTQLPGSATASLQNSSAVNTVKMSIENIKQAGKDVVELRFQLNGSNILTVQDTDETVFLNAGYVGLQGYAINNGTSSIRLLSAVAKQEIDLF